MSRPEGFHTITPYIVASGAARLIEFMKAAFDAEETFLFRNDDGTIGHAELRIGDSMVEVADATEAAPARPCRLHLYVDDTDALYRRALDSGAISLFEPVDHAYGDRVSAIEDPSGNQWYIATHTVMAGG